MSSPKAGPRERGRGILREAQKPRWGGARGKALNEKGALPVAMLLASACAFFFFDCAAGPAVTVVHVPSGEEPEAIGGDPVKLKRASQEPYTAARGGLYVVRSLDDWRAAFRDGQAPPMASTLDTSRQMLFVAVAESNDFVRVKVQRAVETAGMIAVYVRQTKRGQGCVRKSDERTAADAVVTTRVDKPVRFYVDEDRAESCGDPPTAQVSCKTSSQQNWSTKLVANIGDNVECKLEAAAHGKYELVEKLLLLSDAPPGSLAKLAFGKELSQAGFSLDVFGSYSIRAEAKDEAGRRGESVVQIDALPKKSKDILIQQGWADVEVGLDPSTLPRVTLRVAQTGARGQRCSAEVPVPGLCEAKASGSATYMRIPAQSAKLALSLLYLDDKPEKGPAPCLQVWYDGARTSELCDRKARAAEDRWELGTVDTTTGKLTDASAPPPPSAPKKK